MDDAQTKIAQLEYLIEHLSEAEGSRDADYGYVTGKHFQMMTMCPDPDGLAAAINTLPAIVLALRMLASVEVGELVKDLRQYADGGGRGSWRSIAERKAADVLERLAAEIRS